VDQQYVVAVLPFESVSADTSKAYFATGVTEEITGHLSQLSALRVLSRGALAPYRNASDRLPRMAKELGVGSVVEGSVRVSGDRALIAARLIDARSGQTIWTDQYDRELADVFAVQAQVARSITEALHASLTPAEARRAGRPPTVNLAAYELFLQSRRGSHGSTASYEEAIRLLRRAIALDSTFARAYADLAQAFMFLGFARGPTYFDSGAVAAREAVRIDPMLAAGHYALGNNLGEGGRLHASRTSLLRALSLDPNHAGAMMDLSITEEDLGRYDESLHWAMRALPLVPGDGNVHYHVAVPLLQLDDDRAAERFLLRAERRFPTNVRVQLQLATLDLLRGQGEAAIARIRRVAARDPDDSEAQSYLAEFAVMTRAADAEALVGPLARDGPEARPDLMLESFRTLHAWTLARRGERARADSLWTAALAWRGGTSRRGTSVPIGRWRLPRSAPARGDTAAALEWLERGYQAGFRAHRLLARDPLFDGVRAHPRFRQVVQRMQADVAVMRRHAAAAHDTLFTRGPTS
jgi:TolB-like protein/Flp pilus assembly protein TadD